MNRKPRTFKQIMKMAVTKSLIAYIVVAIGFIFMASATDSQNSTPDNRPAAVGSPEQVMDAHGCWSGPAPSDMAGQIPGHVVVRKDGHDKVLYSHHLVGDALDQIFNGADNGLTIYGFCR